MHLHHLHLQTNNLPATREFYTTVLGFPITAQTENSVTFQAGSTALTFQIIENQNPFYHFAFNIPRNQLEKSMKWIAGKVELIENEDNETVTHFESWNAKSVYFYDNNQNILEFIARFELENDSDAPFDTASILCISEIGIVADEPHKLAAEWMQEFNLSPFSKSLPNEKFAVLGDDNGLLIIVETKRKWYPTRQVAEKYFTKAAFSSEENGTLKPRTGQICTV